MNNRIRIAALASLFLVAGSFAGWRVYSTWRKTPTIRVAKAISRPIEPEEPEKTPQKAATKKGAASPATPAPVRPDPGQFGFRGRIFLRLDRNNDRIVTAEELPERYRSLLPTPKGTNTSSASAPALGLTVVEFVEALDRADVDPATEKVKTSPLVSPPPSGQRVPVHAPVAVREPAAASDWLRKLDRDGDGQIGVYEWPPGDLPTFHRLDVNHDGFITRVEAEAREQTRDRKRAPARPGSP